MERQSEGSSLAPYTTQVLDWALALSVEIETALPEELNWGCSDERSLKEELLSEDTVVVVGHEDLHLLAVWSEVESPDLRQTILLSSFVCQPTAR